MKTRIIRPPGFDSAPRSVTAPLLGRIAAGGPILAQEQVEDVFALSGPGAVLSTAGQVEALLPRRDPTTPAVAHADTL